MPTREAITNTIIPQKVEQPIATRIVSTRPPKPQIKDQELPIKEDAAASAPEASVKLSPELSALARKEQAFRQREQTIKDRELLFEEKLKKAEQFDKLKEKLSAKDYSEAESLGLNYEEYAQYKVDKLNGEDPQSAKIKELEDKITALQKGTEESAAEAYESTVREYKKEISALIESNPDYPSIKHLKREDAVLQLILDSWEEDSEEVTIAQAAKDIENFLKEEAKRWEPLLKSSEVDGVEKRPLPKPGLKTLTQQITAGSETRPHKSLQFLSESERYAEARRRVLERREKGK